MAVAAEDDLVAVGEEFAELAVGELEGDGAAAGELEEAAFGGGVGPETVPLARMSPGCRLQPLLVWWVIIWAKDQ